MAQDTAQRADTFDSSNTGQFVKDLGDGLVIRHATPGDAEALANFHAEQHAEPPATFDEGIKVWVLDLMSGNHPTFKPADFILVEDTANGQIASSMCLISQLWQYGGIHVKVGQPEIVSTHPQYRRRGLVREQFDVLHRMSAERGELIQGISGIPWYYRQFGYEMALPMDGGRSGYTPHVPRLGDGAEETYRVRPAAESDIPFMLAMLAQMGGRYEMTAVKDATQLRYELNGRSKGNVVASEQRIIETRSGEAVGLLVHRPALSGTSLATFVYEVEPGTSWAAVTPPVLRYLQSIGLEYTTRDSKEWNAYSFSLGSEHPIYHVIPERLPRITRSYAWYVRVPDVPAFILHIASVLEKRMQDSVVDGHTGELKLNFYRSGLIVGFEDGRLVKAEPWRSESTNEGNAGFPDLTFLQLLFGLHSLEELEDAFPDCWANANETRPLLNTLFPKQPSNVWGNG